MPPFYIFIPARGPAIVSRALAVSSQSGHWEGKHVFCFSSQLVPGQPLAGDLAHDDIEPVPVAHLAVVVTEGLRIEVTEQMERIDAYTQVPFRPRFTRDQKCSSPLVWTSPRRILLRGPLPHAGIHPAFQ